MSKSTNKSNKCLMQLVGGDDSSDSDEQTETECEGGNFFQEHNVLSSRSSHRSGPTSRSGKTSRSVGSDNWKLVLNKKGKASLKKKAAKATRAPKDWSQNSFDAFRE